MAYKFLSLLAIFASLTLALPSIDHVYVPSQPYEPVQIRVAYAGPTGMRVSWNTFSQLPAPPTVKYGLSSDSLPYDSDPDSGESVTYATSLTYNNHVHLTHLSPDTKYYWKPSFSNDTSIFSFTTAKEYKDQSSFKVAVAVDLGLIGPDGLSTTAGKGASNTLKPGEITTIQSLQRNDDWEFLWHPGDIAYADYWLKEELQGYLPNTTIADGYKVYESLLNQYYDEMTPITKQKPYMVGPGNHEANCDNGGTGGYDVTICMPGQTNFTGYRNHFRMPSQESGGLENFWYSFDYGMVHFVQFSTETDLGDGILGPDQPGGLAGNPGENSGPFGIMDQQINWLKQDLASVDRKKTPWIIASGHRPWYVSGTPCADCRKAFEAILYQYNVDLVMFGHVHVFERLSPVFNNTADANGLNNPKFPWYIVNGAAGHYDGLDKLGSPLSPLSQAASDAHYGWSRLTFHNCSHLTHEFIKSSDGLALDTATLFKDRKCKKDH